MKKTTKKETLLLKEIALHQVEPIAIFNTIKEQAEKASLDPTYSYLSFQKNTLEVIIYNEKENYNNNVTMSIDLTNKKTTIAQALANVINFNSIAEMKNLSVLGRPANGYKVKEAKTNKPSELLKLVNKKFVTFFAVETFDQNNYMRLTEFFINEDKETIEANFFHNLNKNYTKTATNKARVDADFIFVIYHDEADQIAKNKEVICQKVNQRRQNKNDFLSRYNYTDEDFRRLESDFNFSVSNFSYNSLKNSAFDTISGQVKLYQKYNFKTVKESIINGRTRQEVFYNIVDRSGYPAFFYREELNSRLLQIKFKKAQEERDRKQAEWTNKDHNEELQELVNFSKKIFAQVEKITSDTKLLLTSASCRLIGEYKTIYQDLKRLQDFDRYTVEKWYEKLQEIKDSFDFWKTAQDKEVVDSVGCKHMYYKEGNAYKMTNQYLNDQYWSSCKIKEL